MMLEPLDVFEESVWANMVAEYIFAGSCLGGGVGEAIRSLFAGKPNGSRALIVSAGPTALGIDPAGYRNCRLLELCGLVLPDLFDLRSAASVVECLVTEYGVDPDHRNAAGRSGLELAARADHFDVCKVLILLGAPLTVYALEHYGADHDPYQDGEEGEDDEDEGEDDEDEGEDDEDEGEDDEDEGEDDEDEGKDDEDENDEDDEDHDGNGDEVDAGGEVEEEEGVPDDFFQEFQQELRLLQQRFHQQIQQQGQQDQLEDLQRLQEDRLVSLKPCSEEDSKKINAAIFAGVLIGPPLSEETKDERRAALLLLLPEPQRRAEHLTPFRHAANWHRRRDVMMFLAEGGHRPLSHRVADGQAAPPPGMDALTLLTMRVFGDEEGVIRHITAML